MLNSKLSSLSEILNKILLLPEDMASIYMVSKEALLILGGIISAFFFTPRFHFTLLLKDGQQLLGVFHSNISVRL